ncbi:hypothetical protein [Aeromicrobium sp. UC242_57]|uniref:hypothetical protein n=1 Tax=Aeromicrobium sp. UC242_57 TaxID=3374624 RepID=UPI00378B66A2
MIDLADLDFSRIVDLIRTAPTDVGLPDGVVSSVTIRMGSVPGTSTGERPSVFVHVSTEFDESGAVQTDLSGDVISIDRGDD